MQKEISEATNGTIKMDNRNEKAQKIWNEI